MFVNWQTHSHTAGFLTAVCTNCHSAILTVPLQDTQTVTATCLFQIHVTCFHRMTIIMQFMSYVLKSLIMKTVAVDVRSSVLPDIGHRTEIWSRKFFHVFWGIVHLLQFIIPTNKFPTYMCIYVCVCVCIYIYIYIYI